MIDINKHKVFLIHILKEIYSDMELAGCLGFKGGTALMLFYGLPRFSVDLDFNLLVAEKEDYVYKKLRKILLNYGGIFDEARKFHGPILVLDYGLGERKLKVEISNRMFKDRYEIKNFLGINMKVMVISDMFAHKLCALLDRNSLAGRDVFDCWFFLKNRFPLNRGIVESRMDMLLADYLQLCIDRLEMVSDKGLLQGVGDLMDKDMKKFVRTKLRTETITLLKLFREYPLLS